MKFKIFFLLWLQLMMVCWVHVINGDNVIKNSISDKYPLEVHQLFQDKLSKKKLPTLGVWSAWSTWTPCSRSCGGGVTQQTRKCVTITSSSQKKKSRGKKRKTERYCIGRYRRFHICNVQGCSSSVDFRREQCEYFNKYLFRGKLYQWEPFLQATEECALNCRPLGANFFATLKKTVIDGTPCFHPFSVTGRAAPSGTRGVCVDRKCMSVASNGVIGALDEEAENCQACARGACRTISGIYQRPDLPQGYSLVAEIPAGACTITLQQLKHTKNHLAVKYPNGSYIINGDWHFSHNHHGIEAAGTKFSYRKQDTTSTEIIISPGPLSHPVLLMIMVQQRNEGVKYVYSLPITSNDIPQIAPPSIKRPTQDITTNLEPRRLNIPISNTITQRDEPKHRRRVRRRFTWKLSGFTPCSRSCGGGTQTTTFSCIREHNQMSVSEKRCLGVEKPPLQQVRCNVQSCPPIWKSSWASCTGSCGQGIQQLIHRCEQEISPGKSTMVNEVACPRPKPLTETKSCLLPPCADAFDNEVRPSKFGNDLQEWAVGIWSQCSVTCGRGQRSRAVACPSGRCDPSNRPTHVEKCEESSSCPDSDENEKPSSPWLTSDWSECSTVCGTGIQTRQSFCTVSHLCDADSQPQKTRDCSSYKQCNGQWFVGPWGPCSDSCNGPARQTRDVHCIIKIRGQPHVTNDMTCNHSDKPHPEQSCYGDCSPRWFVGDWGECEGGCPNRVQRREVRCLDVNGERSNICKMEEMSEIKRSCSCAHRPEVVHLHPLPQDEPVDNGCIDKLQICTAAMQARLCQYDYYVESCCRSCKKFKQDL